MPRSPALISGRDVEDRRYYVMSESVIRLYALLGFVNERPAWQAGTFLKSDAGTLQARAIYPRLLENAP
jgi:hypothetical protein